MTDRIWVTWENQRRNVSMSQAVGSELHVLLSDGGRFLRYSRLIYKTITLLKKTQPSVVFCQNPSLVLSVLLCLLKKRFNYILVVDEHNAGIWPLEGRYILLNKMAHYVLNKADIAIVTNRQLKDSIGQVGAKIVVIPDPVPDVPQAYDNKPHQIMDNVFNVVFICTWADDEPYVNVLDAARGLAEENIHLFVTGNWKKKLTEEPNVENIHLTGFLDDDAYWNLLSDSHCMLVLTTRDDCLNCGAYEAVALGKPGILTATVALKENFSNGFCYTDNTVSSIQKALIEARDNYNNLLAGVQETSKQLQQRVNDGISELESVLLSFK